MAESESGAGTGAASAAGATAAVSAATAITHADVEIAVVRAEGQLAAVVIGGRLVDGDQNLGTGRILHAVRRPHDLGPPVYIDDLQRFSARVVGEKADVVGRMPILGKINKIPLVKTSPYRRFNIADILRIRPRNS